jgi:DDE family transposase
MAKRAQTEEEVKETLVERLTWQTARRDDGPVANAVHEGDELDAVFPLGEVGLLDEFFHFLQISEVLPLLGDLELPPVKRAFLPVIQFVLMYLLKTLLGIESMNALPALLFSNGAAMTLIGFNAYQVANGLTHRGDDKRHDRPKQGPLSPQCLAQNLSKFTTDQMDSLFNGVIRLLVGVVGLSGDLTVALDGSKVETTAKFKGRGCLTVIHKVKERKTGHLVEVAKLLFGWKVLVLIEVRTRLPLALKVVKIQEYEGRWLVPLVKQAQGNLDEHARIGKVVIDRGYLDGDDLWQLHQLGILFVSVAKHGMAVREDAQALAREEAAVERVRVVRHGHGKTAWTEKRTTRLVGIEGLTTYDAYADPEQAVQRNRADYTPQRLNAVVVRTWENREYPQGGIVYLTNGSVQDPFVVFDDYDWRSVIENGIFKEGKHPWHLTHFPQKTEEAVIVHCFFTLLVMALCTAFRLWQAHGAPEEEPPDTLHRPVRRQTQTVPLAITLLGGEGIERWRRRLRAENRDKVVVFVGERYGIFHVSAFAVLAGLRIKPEGIPPELGSPTDILARYGLSP